MKSFIPAAARLSAVVLMSLVSLGVSTQNQAQAANLTFTGTSSGQWGLPENPSQSTQITDQAGGINNRLEWGVPNCIGCTTFNNYVQYDSTKFTAGVGSLFNLGKLTYRNGSTLDAFNGDFPLTVSLLMDGPTQRLQAFSFLFNILNTDNLAADPVLDGDRLRFSTAGLSSQSFEYHGIHYTLQLIGFSLDNGLTILNEFNAPEGETVKASLFGKITTTEACPF